MNASALATFSAPAQDVGLLRRVIGWMSGQPAEGRARAVNLLARTFLVSTLSASGRADALLALTTALDDPSLAVRRALAEALASAAEAPRHIIATLAADRAEVACPVLAHSPRLDDSTLAEVVRHGGLLQQLAVARRARLGARAAHALADVGHRTAALALIENPSASLDPAALARLFERFGEDGAVREALLARGGLAATLRVEIALKSAEALAELSRRWLEPGRVERMLRDGREQAIVRIARDCKAEELPGLVAHLRDRSLLNVALLMRALLSGDVSLFETSLSVMSGAPARRVAGFVADARGRGFAAVYAKAGLPEAFLPAFRAALAALGEGQGRLADGVSHRLAARAIEICERFADPRLEPALALMWRLAGEGAREAAQEEAQAARATPVASIPVAEALAIEAPQVEAQDFEVQLLAEEAPDPVVIDSPTTEILTVDAESSPALPFDPTEAMALELDLVVAEYVAIYADSAAPRLDFAASAPEFDDHAAPVLPPKLGFEGVNENVAPPVALEIAAAVAA